MSSRRRYLTLEDVDQSIIDKNRLTRDYQSNPLGDKDKIPEADLRYLFLELQMSKKECAAYIGKAQITISRALQRYNIHKTKEQIVAKNKATCLKRYGVENGSFLPESRKKSSETSKRLWQDKNWREKIEKTFKEKYGCHPTQCEEVKQKNRQSQIDKRGCLYKQEHLTEQQRKWISNKEELEKFISSQKDKKFFSLLPLIGLSESRFRLYLKKYNLEDKVKFEYLQFERVLKKLIKKKFNLDFEKDRTQLKPLEIDLYNEDLKIGIEFNGSYWHSEKIKHYLYHQDKSLLAQSKGIFLYHIFEHEWCSKGGYRKILNQLSNILQKNNKRIYARQCEIREVSSKEAIEFIEANHIQGADKASVKLGLYYRDSLVQIMTFCKPRFNKKFEWELSRLCSLANITVVGGASKLFKYFVKEYNPKNILSYSDMAKTKGDIYPILGFKLDKISPPNYVYFHSRKRPTLTRYQCQKHKLVKQYPQYKDLSESEIMHKLGYWKIYDSGNRVYTWTNQ